MYKSVAESVATAISLRPLVANANHCEVVIAPTFVSLKTVADRLEGSNIRVAGQDCSTETKHGAHTGEIAASMLAKLGCSYVVVGHSERRQYHAETDEVVAAKLQAAIRHALTPILCVGEGLEVRQAGAHVAHVVAQVTAALEGLPAEAVRGTVLAYEPVWAIGTGEVATPEDAQEVCAAVRARLRELYPDELADAVRVLYGGSVKAANVAALMEQPDVDGALVGGASLDAGEFATLCRLGH